MENTRLKHRYNTCIEFLQGQHTDRGTSCLRKQPLPAADEKIMVDIIIPAYNVEKYIDNCVKSVVRQKTGYPFRMIIVDDGSHDRTGEYIDKYKDTENIVVLHQKNSGVSAARNAGLLQTCSKYVMFLDADDCLAEGAIERLVTRCEIERASIIAGSYCNFKVSRFLHRSYYQKEGQINSELEMSGHAWGKVYRRELFERVQFPENYWFEDSVMQQIVFPQAEKMNGIRDVVYLRRINPGSITQTAAGNLKSLDSLWVTLRLMKDREQLGIARDDVYYRYLLRQTKLNHVRLRGMSEEIREAAFIVIAIRLQELFPGGVAENKEEREIARAVNNLDYEHFAALLAR